MTLRESQNKKIACYLKSGRSITQDEAIKMFSCYRLASRVFELRDKGLDIKTIMREREHTDPETGVEYHTQYAEYKL